MTSTSPCRHVPHCDPQTADKNIRVMVPTFRACDSDSDSGAMYAVLGGLRRLCLLSKLTSSPGAANQLGMAVGEPRVACHCVRSMH